MIYRSLASFLVVLALAGCGGDDDDNGDGNGGESKPLQFEQVRSFTLEHPKGEDSFVGCENPDWNWVGAQREKQAQTAVTQAKRAETLRCPDGIVNEALYLEFSDAATARERLDALYGQCLGEACSPYLVAEHTAVVTPVADEKDAAYLEALKAECGCGEVVTPKASQ
jgi:hypothetical protein